MDERAERLIAMAGAERAGRWKAEEQRDELRAIASDLLTLTPGGKAWNGVVDRLHELDAEIKPALSDNGGNDGESGE